MYLSIWTHGQIGVHLKGKNVYRELFLPLLNSVEPKCGDIVIRQCLNQELYIYSWVLPEKYLKNKLIVTMRKILIQIMIAWNINNYNHKKEWKYFHANNINLILLNPLSPFYFFHTFYRNLFLHRIFWKNCHNKSENLSE